MSKFFNKPFANVLGIFLKIARLKIAKKSNFNFMKHKMIFVTFPLILITVLMSIFIYNICTDKYDMDSLFENTKTVIDLPVNKDVDSSTLNEIQNIATNLVNYNSNAQFVSKYSGFINELLKKVSGREIKITTNKKFILTQQQKEILFNKIQSHFPNLIKIKNANEITSYNLTNTQKNWGFWMQLSVAGSILIVLLILYFGIKFKKLGFWSAIIVALTNLIFSIGSTLLILIILTNKINLTFMLAMSFYFTINLTALFNEIRKQLPETKINKTTAIEVANKAIQKTIPTAIFIIATSFVALVSSTIFCLIFNNYILFYLVLSTIIGILLDLFFNIFCNCQLWTMLKRKEIKVKTLKQRTVSNIQINKKS